MEQLQLEGMGAPKTVRTRISPDIPCPIQSVPFLVRLQSTSEDGKSDWVNNATPERTGFYEVMVQRVGWACELWTVPYCWWDARTLLWWNAQGEVEPNVIRYRGVVEEVGRQRRRLLP